MDPVAEDSPLVSADAIDGVGEDPELDAKRFRRTENGICLITKDMIARLDA